jgi:hypothetical protein
MILRVEAAGRLVGGHNAREERLLYRAGIQFSQNWLSIPREIRDLSEDV